MNTIEQESIKYCRQYELYIVGDKAYDPDLKARQTWVGDDDTKIKIKILYVDEMFKNFLYSQGTFLEKQIKWSSYAMNALVTVMALASVILFIHTVAIAAIGLVASLVVGVAFESTVVYHWRVQLLKTVDTLALNRGVVEPQLCLLSGPIEPWVTTDKEGKLFDHLEQVTLVQNRFFMEQLHINRQLMERIVIAKYQGRQTDKELIKYLDALQKYTIRTQPRRVVHLNVMD